MTFESLRPRIGDAPPSPPPSRPPGRPPGLPPGLPPSLQPSLQPSRPRGLPLGDATLSDAGSLARERRGDDPVDGDPDTGSAHEIAPFGLLATTDLGAGMVIAGRYAIRSPLGSGGMGQVFLAEHIGVGRMVAVKILDHQRSALPPMIRRFRDEARAANVVDHPAIAAVFDCGELDDGRLFLAMEYVRGTVLSDMIRNEAPVEWERAARLTLEIADGMAAVHRAGMIHRDLKPSNLMVIHRGEAESIKVLDFGIAANLATPPPEDGRLTRPGQLVGTPLYMAPEQTQGAPATPAMDVYAIAVILYEMIRGELPHYDVDPFDLVARKRRQEAPALVGVPEALQGLVAASLSIDPSRRPADAGVFGERLRAVLEGPTAPPRRRRAAWLPLVASAALLASLAAMSFSQAAGPTDLPADPPQATSDHGAVDPGAVADGASPTPRSATPTAEATMISASDGSPPIVAEPVAPKHDDASASKRTIAPSRADRSASKGVRCDLARSSAEGARVAHEWESVLRHSRDAACWPDPESRRALRVKAAFELGDHEACKREGAGARDPDTAKMVAACARALREG